MNKRLAVRNKLKGIAALEAIRSSGAIGTIARRLVGDPSQVERWRTELRDRSHRVFEDGAIAESKARELQALYRQAYRLKVEHEFDTRRIAGKR